MRKREAVLATMMGLGMFNGMTVAQMKKPRWQKHCLQCRKGHSHNNSWCSTKCKAEYDDNQ